MLAIFFVVVSFITYEKPLAVALLLLMAVFIYVLSTEFLALNYYYLAGIEDNKIFLKRGSKASSIQIDLSKIRSFFTFPLENVYKNFNMVMVISWREFYTVAMTKDLGLIELFEKKDIPRTFGNLLLK